MKTVGMDQLRTVVEGLSEGGKKDVSNAMLYESLGLEEADEKARLRRRVNDMVKRSELVRIRPGWFSYNPKAKPQRNSEFYIRIWRLVRAKGPGWTKQDMAVSTRASYTMASRYINWLEEEGFVARHGRKGNTAKYRTTSKAREELQTPYPPIAPSDPFAQERSACCRLVRLMMERDPYQTGVRKKILNELAVMNDRFQPKEER
jgi:predicted transcriptional regulator